MKKDENERVEEDKKVETTSLYPRRLQSIMEKKRRKKESLQISL